MTKNNLQNSMDELFWQLQSLKSATEREKLLSEIRAVQPVMAEALAMMLRNEARAAGFMNLSNEVDSVLPPADGTEFHADPTNVQSSADSRFEVTQDSHPSARAVAGLGTDKFPKQIGPYKMLEPIGEGGMGIVYLALQLEPVRRKVALKIIKPGMDSRQVVARFEAERQALAMMDHPHISKVLDAGTTETGLPFFVMELVRGIPITDYCDQLKMPTRQRLELFRDICEAIQHAHNKGIIHRDIKPSNVLVTEQDGDSIVKVIDFGVAKALTDNLTDKTLFTGMFQLMGTPLYMSPEQASVSGVDVDVRSDVYSLGVMLYELLSGSLPVDREEVKGLSFEKLRERICETEPPKPSKRLSTLKDDARETIAERRGVNVTKLDRLVSNELDWIVMRSLEKDRSRRYQSAREFGDDIGRFLSGDAVEACPPSTVYKLQKLYRKNRSLVATATIVLLTLFCATGFSAWQAWQATLAKQESDKNAKLAIAKAAEAKAVTEFVVDGLFGSALPGESTSPNLTINQILQRAERNLDSTLGSQPIVLSSVQGMIGQIYNRLDLKVKAADTLTEAIQIRQQHVDSSDLELLRMRRFRAQSLADGKQEFLNAANELKNVIEQLASTEGDSSPETLEARMVLADVYTKSGDYGAAIAILEPLAENIRESLGGSDELIFKCLNYLAIAQGAAGKELEKIATLRGAIANASRSDSTMTPTLLSMRFNLASAIGDTDPKESLAILERCENPIRHLYGEESLLYCLSLLSRGKAESALERYDAAEEHMQRGLALMEKAPGIGQFRVEQARQAYANLLDAQKRYVESQEIYRKILREFESTLGPNHPQTVNVLLLIANTELMLGQQSAYLQLLTEALSRYEQRFGTADRNWSETAIFLAADLCNAERWDEGEKLLRRIIDCGLQISDKVMLRNGESAQPVSMAFEWLNDRYFDTERFFESEQLMDQSLKFLKADPIKDPLRIWATRLKRGKAIVAQHRFEEALPELHSVLQYAIDAKLEDRLTHSRTALSESYLAWAKWTGFEAPEPERDAVVALNAAKKALDYKPNRRDRWLVGLLHCEVRDFEAAATMFQEVASEQKGKFANAAFRFPMAIALAELGEVEAAKESFAFGYLHYMTSWTLDPWIESYRERAILELKITQEEIFSSTLQLAQQLSKEKPANVKYQMAIAELMWLQYIEKGKLPNSAGLESAFGRITQLDGLTKQTQVSLSLSPLLILDDKQQAYKTELSRLLKLANERGDELTPESASYIVRFACLLDEKPADAIAGLAEQAVAEEDARDYQLSAKASFDLRSGRFTNAIDWLKKANAVAGHNNPPIFAAMLSIAYAKEGDSLKAEEWFKRSRLQKLDLPKYHVHQIVEWVFYRREAGKLLRSLQTTLRDNHALMAAS